MVTGSFYLIVRASVFTENLNNFIRGYQKNVNAMFNFIRIKETATTLKCTLTDLIL